MDERATQSLIEAVIASLISVELCLIATAKASSGQVKDFAGTALDAHCQIAKAVVDAALDQGIAIPADFSDEHRNAMHMLLNLPQEEFDRAFIEGLIREDEATFFFLAGETIAGLNPNMDTITSFALPLIESQLWALRSITLPRM